jgi:hypothetical protein
MSSKSFFARRELSALPIDAVLQGKLAAAGFRTVGDVCSVQTEELMQELDISEEHAADIRNVIDRVQSGTQEAEYSGTPSPSQATTVASASASQLLSQEKHRKSVISFSRQIDGVSKHDLCLFIRVAQQLPTNYCAHTATATCNVLCYADRC